jgi:hypothetical protein
MPDQRKRRPQARKDNSFLHATDAYNKPRPPQHTTNNPRPHPRSSPQSHPTHTLNEPATHQVNHHTTPQQTPLRASSWPGSGHRRSGRP